MRFVVNFLFVFLFSIVSHAINALSIVIGCEIYSTNKKLIRKYPGEICLFLDNGSFLSSQQSKIILYDKNNLPVWEKNILAHHQINLNLDKSKFLIIASEAKIIDKKKVRSDILYIINLSGKTEKTFSLYDNSKSIDSQAWNNSFNRKFPMSWGKSRFKNYDWEITHTNSFYQIPNNSKSNTFLALNEGNYIFNDISLMRVFIINKKFDKIIWQDSIKSHNATMLHDVQVLKNGNILVYDNGTHVEKYSSLYEYDLLNKKIIWLYKANPPNTFFSIKSGGVQKTEDGNYFFSNITNGPEVIEINSSGKVLWRLTLEKERYLQQAKLINLDNFLKLNKGI